MLKGRVRYQYGFFLLVLLQLHRGPGGKLNYSDTWRACLASDCKILHGSVYLLHQNGLERPELAEYRFDESVVGKNWKVGAENFLLALPIEDGERWQNV